MATHSFHQRKDLLVEVHEYRTQQCSGVCVMLDIDGATIDLHLKSVDAAIRLGEQIEQQAREMAAKLAQVNEAKEKVLS